MSFGPMIETKQCSCGKFYETDCGTLGIDREKCGMCGIADSITELKQISALIYYVVSKSDIENENDDMKQITRNLLKGKLSEELIEKGLEDKVLTEICSALDSNNVYVVEVRRDLAKYLKEYDNINDFIRTLLMKRDKIID